MGITRRAAMWSAAAILLAPAAMAARVCDVSAYGAKGNGQTKDTAAIQRAIDACAEKGGGIVLLKQGTFLSGPIELKSHITLDVAAGATLLGSQDKADYSAAQELRQASVEPLIDAKNAEDVTLRGGGTINGNGSLWWSDVYSHKHMPDFPAEKRPRLIILDHCRHVLIENLTIENSASWQVVPYYSNDVIIRDAKFLAPARSPNTDGIDPFSSHHVTIERVIIDVGDDNVAIKSGQPGSPGPDAPSTDIVVRDCKFLHGHGMSIGSEIAGGVQNVLVDNVTFDGTRHGIRLKSNRDRGGNIGNFQLRNLTMKNVEDALIISAYYPKVPKNVTAMPVTRLTPRFHNIHITHLQAIGVKNAGVVIGLPESPVKGVVLDDVHIQAQHGITMSYASVKAHDFTVQAAQGQGVTLLTEAKLSRN